MSIAKSLFRDRSRSARQLKRQIEGLARRGAEKTKPVYQKLVTVARASVKQAQTVIEKLQVESSKASEQVKQDLQSFLTRTQQVIEQTVQRVFKQETVPTSERLVSIFEPHTDIIKCGKAGKATEFGHKVWLDELDGGIVSDYRILKGNPADTEQWQAAIEQHMEHFGKVPYQASADRETTRLIRASNGSFCPKRVTNHKHDASMNAKHGFDVGDVIMLVSKDASVF